MDEIRVKARAKINLSLDIMGKRDDGYHEISTIMQSVELFDSLHIKKVYKPNYLKLVTNISWLATDEKNLVYLAAAYLKKEFNIKTGIFINLKKNIPASAGLGGGSADCAAAMAGIRNLFKLPLTDDDLIEIAGKFGADVPFCIKGGLAHATGIGEKLEPLPKLPMMHIVLIKPLVIVSTEEVFKGFRLDKVTHRPNTEGMLKSIQNGDWEGICNSMGNVLESVTANQYPIIKELKEVLLGQGAMAAMMTGSGPTVFGVFARRSSAENAVNVLRKNYPDFNEIYLTKSI